MNKNLFFTKSAIIMLAVFFVFAEPAFAITYKELWQNQIQTSGKVLGESVYESVRVFSAGNLKLYVTPVAYNSSTDKWNYRISWNRMANRTGSIYINGNFFYDNASGSGQNETGFSLDPDARYRITYYSSAGGRGVKIVNRFFKTLSAPVDDTPDTEDNSSNSDNSPSQNTTPNNTTNSSYRLKIETAYLAQGTVGSYYTASISFNYNGKNALNGTWSGLPDGIVGQGQSSNPNSFYGILPGLQNTVSLSGTPKQAGTYSVTLNMTDQYGGTDSRTFTLVINPVTVSKSLSIDTTNLPDAIVGQPYSTQINVSGGTAPYTWTTISTTYPSGCCVLGLASNGKSSVEFNTQSGSTISYNPGAGNFTWTIQVKDANGNTATKTLGLNINSASILPDFYTYYLAMSPSQMSNNQITVAAGQPITVSFSVTNGGSNSSKPSMEIQFTGAIMPTINDTQIQENTCSSKSNFATGETCIFATRLTYTQPGSYSVNFVVDKSNAIIEQSKSNNSILVPFVVK